MLVIGPDIFTSETLDDNHHHVLFLEGGRISRLMNGLEYLRHLGLALEEIRHLELVETIGTDKRERRVEYDARLRRTIAIVVGVRYGDGSYIACPSASHTSHAERRVSQERYKGGNGVRLPLQLTIIQLGCHVTLPHAIHQQGCQEEEIPVVQRLLPEDAAQVVLIAELMEYGNGGAAHGVLEIHGIAEVEYQREGIYDYKHPLAYLVVRGVLLLVNREEHHHHPKGIGVEHG